MAREDRDRAERRNDVKSSTIVRTVEECIGTKLDEEIKRVMADLTTDYGSLSMKSSSAIQEQISSSSDAFKNGVLESLDTKEDGKNVRKKQSVFGDLITESAIARDNIYDKLDALKKHTDALYRVLDVIADRKYKEILEDLRDAGLDNSDLELLDGTADCLKDIASNIASLLNCNNLSSQYLDGAVKLVSEVYTIADGRVGEEDLIDIADIFGVETVYDKKDRGSDRSRSANRSTLKQRAREEAERYLDSLGIKKMIDMSDRERDKYNSILDGWKYDEEETSVQDRIYKNKDRGRDRSRDRSGDRSGDRSRDRSRDRSEPMKKRYRTTAADIFDTRSGVGSKRKSRYNRDDRDRSRDRDSDRDDRYYDASSGSELIIM